jgi:hypothetical protein
VGDGGHQRDLAEANRLIARSEEIVTKQRALVERLERDGLDASGAKKVLALLERSLELMRAQREIVLRR